MKKGQRTRGHVVGLIRFWPGCVSLQPPFPASFSHVHFPQYSSIVPFHGPIPFVFPMLSLSFLPTVGANKVTHEKRHEFTESVIF
jgi:hypothetical protein